MDFILISFKEIFSLTTRLRTQMNETPESLKSTANSKDLQTTKKFLFPIESKAHLNNKFIYLSAYSFSDTSNTTTPHFLHKHFDVIEKIFVQWNTNIQRLHAFL